MALQSNQRVQELLFKLENGLLDGKIEAIRELAQLPESNESIVRALIVARDTNNHSRVKEAATNALQAPAHQQILASNPNLLSAGQEEVVAKVKRQEYDIQESNKKRKAAPFLIVAGIVILVGAVWASIASYNEAASSYYGGTYYIYWGPALFGLSLIGGGISNLGI